ncbi:hypothetical protein HIM_02129 [Hirsutella minnesotensis 3608]|nr:hypothetical protein HIM_02129 [Hirsutella minnesotensis 3608]
MSPTREERTTWIRPKAPWGRCGVLCFSGRSGQGSFVQPLAKGVTKKLRRISGRFETRRQASDQAGSHMETACDVLGYIDPGMKHLQHAGGHGSRHLRVRKSDWN